jgi:hypothetical protein
MTENSRIREFKKTPEVGSKEFGAVGQALLFP